MTKGFTLIELLVVIAIIGILVSVTLSAVSKTPVVTQENCQQYSSRFLSGISDIPKECVTYYQNLKH